MRLFHNSVMQPQAVRCIRGLGNRRVHLGGGIVVTSDSGIDYKSTRWHRHNVQIAFGPPLPKEKEYCFHHGALTLLDWHKSLGHHTKVPVFEHHGDHCHPQYSSAYIFTHGLRITVISSGRMHTWTLKVEQKAESNLEELRAEHRLPLLEWHQFECDAMP